MFQMELRSLARQRRIERLPLDLLRLYKSEETKVFEATPRWTVFRKMVRR